MKRILIVLFACLLAGAVLFGIAGITATNLFASGGLRGSGNIVTKRIEAPDFAAIDASRAVKVIVTDALTDEIVIEADDNVMEKVLVESRRGTLFVGIDKSVRRISDYSVTVRVPANGEIRALDASSAAKIICETALEAYEFLIERRADRCGAEGDAMPNRCFECGRAGGSPRGGQLHGRPVECREGPTLGPEPVVRGGCQLRGEFRCRASGRRPRPD